MSKKRLCRFFDMLTGGGKLPPPVFYRKERLDSVLVFHVSTLILHLHLTDGYDFALLYTLSRLVSLSPQPSIWAWPATTQMALSAVMSSSASHRASRSAGVVWISSL